MAAGFDYFILQQVTLRKTFALMLGVLIFNSTTEMHQLLKFPFLIRHYFYHCNEDPSISIIGFFKIHYSDRQHPNDNDDDDDDDNKLPFKAIGDISHIDVPVLEKRTSIYSNIYQAEKQISYHSEGTLVHRSFSIFHPPRAL